MMFVFLAAHFCGNKPCCWNFALASSFPSIEPWVPQTIGHDDLLQAVHDENFMCIPWCSHFKSVGPQSFCSANLQSTGLVASLSCFHKSKPFTAVDVRQNPETIESILLCSNCDAQRRIQFNPCRLNGRKWHSHFSSSSYVASFDVSLRIYNSHPKSATFCFPVSVPAIVLNPHSCW